ncbi:MULTISPECIES: lysozyme inhibitor LprI family protein [unclassified Acinetobacter]|uniref:lysozyme inhibitor LprI family protein n=1 Tax=unclassified Acinetobacter TaxID=196816 RepID=UPI0015D1113F|nr:MULTISPECIES: lysozyme inhibitor LprI family protein [unclassified Acinetobacter]
MIKQFICALMVVLGFIQMAQAEDRSLSKHFTACMDKAGGVTASMVECTAAETKRQDIRLNEAYKNLMNTLSATRKKELQNTQRLWMKYRDANCNFYYDPNGGSIVRVTSAGCFMDMTAERANELENFLKY